MGKGSEYTFLKRRDKMAKSYMKCSTPLIIRKCKSKPQCDIIPHMLGGLYSKKKQQTRTTGKDMEIKKHVSGNINW